LFILYDLLFFIFIIFYFPVLMIRGKWHRGYIQRWGVFASDLKSALIGRKNIWIHAVSIGEVSAVIGLIRRLKKEYPSLGIVCSTVTQTGYSLAKQSLNDGEVVIFAPLDFSFVVKKFIRLICPKVYIAAETELWPNLYTFLDQQKIPIVLVNGRISDRSLGRYKRGRFLVKKILSRVSLFCMQGEVDAKRIVEIGALQGRTKVVGNLKFDSVPFQEPLDPKTLGFSGQDLIFIAGSTHPGEEKMVLDVFKNLKSHFSNLRLILSPRHVDRVEELKALVNSLDLKPIFYSKLNGRGLNEDDVMIVDKIGVLFGLYSLATVVFIGKTLAVGGGQNMIEPAFFSKPVLIGPMTQNFKDVVRIFLKNEAMIQVQDKRQLTDELQRLLRDPSHRDKIGICAGRTVAQYRGATDKTIQLLKEFVNGSPINR